MTHMFIAFTSPCSWCAHHEFVGSACYIQKGKTLEVSCMLLTRLFMVWTHVTWPCIQFSWLLDWTIPSIQYADLSTPGVPTLLPIYPTSKTRSVRNITSKWLFGSFWAMLEVVKFSGSILMPLWILMMIGINIHHGHFDNVLKRHKNDTHLIFSFHVRISLPTYH